MTGPQGQRPRVDWDAAKAFYVALPPAERTYIRVAAEFHVSSTSVYKHAKREHWHQAAVDTDEAALGKAMNRVVRSRSERVQRVLLLVDDVVDKAEAKLKQDTLSIKAADVASLVKLAELLTGEPTDRIQISQLQPLIDSYDNAVEKLRALAADAPEADEVIRRLDEDLLAYAATARAQT